MTIVLPWTEDRDRLGHALYDALIKAELIDLACECAYVIRAARDTAAAFDAVRTLTRDAEIAFEWEVG